MELINPWLLYLVMQADSIITSVRIFGMFTMIAAIACGATAIALTPDTSYDYHRRGNRVPDDEEISRHKSLIKWAVRFTAAAALLFSVAFFIPSTKTAAVLLVVPTLANNPTIQKEAGDIYTIAKEALREKLDTPAPESKEENHAQ